MPSYSSRWLKDICIVLLACHCMFEQKILQNEEESQHAHKDSRLTSGAAMDPTLGLICTLRPHAALLYNGAIFLGEFALILLLSENPCHCMEPEEEDYIQEKVNEGHKSLSCASERERTGFHRKGKSWRLLHCLFSGKRGAFIMGHNGPARCSLYDHGCGRASHVDWLDRKSVV